MLDEVLKAVADQAVNDYQGRQELLNDLKPILYIGISVIIGAAIIIIASFAIVVYNYYKYGKEMLGLSRKIENIEDRLGAMESKNKSTDLSGLK